MGEFNCDMLRPNSCACRLAMAMSEYGMTEWWLRNTQIDLLFTTDTDVVESVGCEEPGKSDHSLIYGQLTSKVQRMMKDDET